MKVPGMAVRGLVDFVLFFLSLFWKKQKGYNGCERKRFPRFVKLRITSPFVCLLPNWCGEGNFVTEQTSRLASLNITESPSRAAVLDDSGKFAKN